LNLKGERPVSVLVVGDATILQDGSSPECEQRCRSNGRCTGYMTHDTESAVWTGKKTGTCGILTDPNFQPTYIDRRALNTKCFWKHAYDRATSGLYTWQEAPIPSVIWTYWRGVADDSGAKPPAFVDMCVKGWQFLNPGYNIHVLTPETVSKWLSPSDLPETFKDLPVQHQSEIVRLALLLKYGGVWLDPTVFLTRSLTSFMERASSSRTFFHTEVTEIPQELQARNKRVGILFKPDDWFLASPPRDPFINRTQSCYRAFIDAGGYEVKQRGLADLGMFDQQQLEDMFVLGVKSGLTACMFKTVDEDLTMESWWLSGKVHHIYQAGPFGGAWLQRHQDRVLDTLWHQRNAGVAAVLTYDGVYALHFPEAVEQDVEASVSADVLWCGHNTWHMVLRKIGLEGRGPQCSAGR